MIYVLGETEDQWDDAVATEYVRRTCRHRLRAGWLVRDQHISYGANGYMFHWNMLAHVIIPQEEGELTIGSLGAPRCPLTDKRIASHYSGCYIGW